MQICVETKFEAAHFIPKHPKCGKVHGHTYKLKAVVEGKVKETGMVIDFGDIKEVLRQFDHCCINEAAKEFEIQLLKIPTAENLAKYFAEEIEKLGDNLWVSVTVWETEDSCAEYEI